MLSNGELTYFKALTSDDAKKAFLAMSAAERAARTGSDDEVVKQQCGAIRQMHFFVFGINVCDLGQQRGQVGLVPEQAAGRRCNRGRCQTGGGDLVQQRLKQMVIGFVDQRDIDRGFGQRFGSF
jgi:hypothetical protein